jgi:hypothetical protein
VTKEKFSQYSLNGRKELLDLYGKVISRKKYPEKYHLIYQMFDFYVIKSIKNTDNSVIAIEVIDKKIVTDFFLDN